MARIRVLVVDDAVVMRRLISSLLEEEPDIEVVGIAAHGRLALAKIPQVNPDCITLDVEMPEMDGLETVVEIRKLYPALPVIMFSNVTEKGASKTLEALARGATDYVTKPANTANFKEATDRLRLELIPKIRLYCGRAPAVAPQTPAVRAVHAAPKDGRLVEAICLASSTGGPAALAKVVPAIPGRIGVPVLSVQHMPPLFTAMLAERLNAASGLTVQEGKHGAIVEPGNMYIAPGGRHMEVRRRGVHVFIELSDAPPENSCRPAADVLFRSAASAYGAGIVAAVLTGMGQDGMRGAECIADLGGEVIAQDEASSVVWGMPGAVTNAGLARQVLPLDDIAPALVRAVERSRLSPVGSR